MAHPLVKLAKEAIESYIREKRTPKPPEEPVPEMQGRAGAFVSLHDSRGNLRGCIGTIEPQQPTVAQEVIQNAISAATRDPRFPPVQPEELEGLDIKVEGEIQDQLYETPHTVSWERILMKLPRFIPDILNVLEEEKKIYS